MKLVPCFLTARLGSWLDSVTHCAEKGTARWSLAADTTCDADRARCTAGHGMISRGQIKWSTTTIILIKG